MAREQRIFDGSVYVLASLGWNAQMICYDVNPN